MERACERVPRALRVTSPVDSLARMARRLVRLARLCAVLWLAVAISGVFEMMGDCGDEESAVQSAAAVCLHGDGGQHDSESKPCSTTDHHSAPSCGCGCHHVSLVAQTHGLATVARVTLISTSSGSGSSTVRLLRSFVPPSLAEPSRALSTFG